MIILFGSYARNDWVEEKYDDGNYKYQSDIDVLVIVESKNGHTQTKYEANIQDKVYAMDSIKTPVSAIVNDIDFVNCRLKKAQFFFSDIKKEGVLLYDSKKHQLSEPKKLAPQEQKKLVQDDFNYCFEKANEFRDGVEFYLNRGNFNTAAFLLHPNYTS